MKTNSTTYAEMYEGAIRIPNTSPPQYIYDPTYYYGEIGFKLERTHKLALDKPTVTISIPVSMLKLSENDCGCVAAGDHILRALKPYFDGLNDEIANRNRPDKENGKYYIYAPTGEVIKRNCVYFGEVARGYVSIFENEDPPVMCVNIITQVQLPSKKIKKAIQMLTKSLPMATERFAMDFDADKLRRAIELNKKQEEIRAWLKAGEYCAFVANGAVLPRKGNTQLPAENAVPFKSPPQDEVTVCGLGGMGIKKGVTVITGGGYSGKSTLLDAVSAGVYNHVSGDGREFVVTDDSAVKISAEDGRSVAAIDLSPFIKWLPNGGDAGRFCTGHASGSTSQAANIIEAANFGAKLFLIDEDKSATNFMIRDDMMKELIKREPITPFTDRVRQLYSEAGISTILVVGGSGEYLSVADSVIMMDEFHAHNATERAKQVYMSAKNIAAIERESAGAPSSQTWRSRRRLVTEKFTSYPKESEDAYSGTERLEISDMGFIIIGDEKIDIRGLHNFISFAQITAVGYMLRYLEVSSKERVSDTAELIDRLYGEIEEKGLDFVHSTFFACERWLDMPRKCELAAVINRMRRVDFV